MTQQDKELLLKDLSARLPYEVKVKVRSNDIRTVRAVDMVEEIVHFVESDSISPFGVHIEHPMSLRQIVKPYLRPMSSMTEEERKEFEDICTDIAKDRVHFVMEGSIDSNYMLEKFDWLNKNMFDYRYLIGKGLAIEVNENNNPYKK